MCLELGTWKRYESELDRIAQMGQPKELLLDIACGQLEYDSLRTSQTRLELVRCPVLMNYHTAELEPQQRQEMVILIGRAIRAVRQRIKPHMSSCYHGLNCYATHTAWSQQALLAYLSEHRLR